MNTEIWDIIDEKGKLTGKTTFRGHCVLKPGEYHLVVHIWITTSDGKIIIQRRSDKKKLMPGEWAATGGAAISGEDSFCAAKRELFEELGISADRETLKNIGRIKRRNSFVDIWFTVCDTPIEQMVLQASEVAEVKSVSFAELKEMIKNGKYHNYGTDYFKTVFDGLDEIRKVYA